MKTLGIILGLFLSFIFFSGAAYGYYTDEVEGYTIIEPEGWDWEIIEDSQWGRVVKFTSNQQYTNYQPYFLVMKSNDEKISYDPNSPYWEKEKEVTEFLDGFKERVLFDKNEIEILQASYQSKTVDDFQVTLGYMKMFLIDGQEKFLIDLDLVLQSYEEFSYIFCILFQSRRLL